MNLKKNLVLLGMMASGKSTIGALLSKKLGLKFYDIDKMIEEEMHMTIAEIFDQKSEIFFRSLEEKITLEILNSSNNIIALGGGGFLNNKIRKEIIDKNFSPLFSNISVIFIFESFSKTSSISINFIFNFFEIKEPIVDFPDPIIPIKIRFFFDFISFFIEKTQICLNLNYYRKDICNFKEIQVLANIMFL